MTIQADKADLIATEDNREADALTTERVFFWLAVLFLLNLLLRLFYFRYDFVNGDEAVRALTAARVLDGARLYTDIVTDKPPGATLFYAMVFALFGRSMKAVHVVAALWNFATAMIVYLTSARLFTRRAALWAALLFVYFSTNYLTPDMMAANTEMLMALPYTAAFYFFIRAYSDSGERTQPRRALPPAMLFAAAGLMTGLAALFKQVAVFNLAFFALYEFFDAISNRAKHHRTTESSQIGYGWLAALKRATGRLLLVAAGFAFVMTLFFAHLKLTGTLDDFWRYAISLGMLYIDAMPPGLWWRFMLGRVFGYVLFNAALWSLAVWAAARACKSFLKRRNWDDEARDDSRKAFRFDMAITLWAAMSLSGVFTSGRFFGHYFIQMLPALSMLASRAVVRLGDSLKNQSHRRSAQAAVAALVILFLFGFVRIHHRTAILAYETITGARTRWSQNWGMTEREDEAAIIAQRLRGEINAGQPLYIWGYALDIYWRTGARPASRFLTPYYITGRFPEITTELAPPDERFWAEARTSFIEDLRRSRPRLILDVDGSFLQLPYKEVTDFIRENYDFNGAEKIGPDPARPFFIYRLKQTSGGIVLFQSRGEENHLAHVTLIPKLRRQKQAFFFTR
ncbi:MAG TPA: glycosyltransferase family 39 protein [Blastocatellia bacterium]|nr:glycosyltransferase family 39 protein [Blastocatellia bacterium]